MIRAFLPLMVLVLLVSGCAAGAASSEVAVDSAGIDALPGETGSGDCIEIKVMSSAGPPDDLRELATEVVLGTFVGYGPSRWNTPDGHRPSKVEAQQKPARLIRSLIITPIEQIVGSGSSIDRAVVRGGILGCDRVSFDVDTPLTAGATYVFFLFPIQNSEGQLSGDQSMIMAWPVHPDGTVSTGAYGDLQLDAAKDVIINGPRPVVPPSPGEPTSGPPA